MTTQPLRSTLAIIGIVAGVSAIAAIAYLMGTERPPAPSGEEHISPLAVPGEQSNRDALMSDEMALPVSAVTVEYSDGFMGFHAYPSEGDGYPGVVMIHEWWGLNDNIRDMARELAGKGYDVLAVDLFGRVAATPDEAREQTSSLDQEAALANMRDAAAFLRARGAERIASYGWCFGGGQSLQLALAEPLDATVIFYGRLVTEDEALKAINGPVLGIFGAEDTGIPVESVDAFAAALDRIGVENETHVYPGVGHAFANPSGANYAPEETADSWAKTLEFLERNLK